MNAALRVAIAVGLCACGSDGVLVELPPEDPPPADVEPRLPGVGPMLALDPSVVLQEGSGIGRQPVVAFDGEVYVAAFVESYSFSLSPHPSEAGAAIRMFRFRRDGAPLDRAGFVVARNVERHTKLRLAAGHGMAMVVWQQVDPATSETHAYLARIRTADGAVLDDPTMPLRSRFEAGTRLGFTNDTQLEPDVVFHRDRFVVAWSDGESGRIAQFDPDTGRPGAPLAIPSRLALRMASAPDGLAIAAVRAASSVPGDCGQLALHRIRHTGPTINLTDINTSPGFGVEATGTGQLCSQPEVVVVANRIVMAWARIDRTAPTRRQVRIAELVDGGVAPAVSIFDQEGHAEYPAFALVATGEHAIVLISPHDLGTSTSARALDAYYVGAGGVVAEVTHVVTGTESRTERPHQLTAAFDGTRVLVGWFHEDWSGANPGGLRRRWLPRVPGTAAPLGADGLWGAAPQDSVVVATSGDVMLAVWHEETGHTSDGETGERILATRVRISDGEILDRSPLELDRRPCRLNDCPLLGAPHVAASARDFFVVWDWTTQSISHREVLGRRVKREGALPDARPIRLQAEPMAEQPRIASDGHDYLLVYRSLRWAGHTAPPYVDQTIRAVTIETAGSTPVLRRSVVTTSSISIAQPDVAADADGYVVVWQDCGSEPGYDGCVVSPGALYAARVAGAQASEAVPLMVGTGLRPRVALADGRALVVWNDRLVARGQILRAGDLRAEGDPLTFPSDRAGASIAAGADDRGFLAAWRTGNAVLGRRIDPTGASVDVHPPLTLHPFASTPSVIGVRPGEFIVGFGAVDARLGRERAVARRVIHDRDTPAF